MICDLYVANHNLSLGHKYPYERRTNNFLTIYVMVKNRSYGVRKGICDQGFTYPKQSILHVSSIAE